MSASEPLYSSWLRKGDHDFLAIRRVMVGDDVPWDIVAFHAQQGAEKYLKGFIRYHGGRPPKIHDLSRLLDLCLAYDESLASLRSGCIELTDAGYQSRYPDSTEDPSEEIARHAVELAVLISEAIRQRMPLDAAL